MNFYSAERECYCHVFSDYRWSWIGNQINWTLKQLVIASNNNSFSSSCILLFTIVCTVFSQSSLGSAWQWLLSFCLQWFLSSLAGIWLTTPCWLVFPNCVDSSAYTFNCSCPCWLVSVSQLNYVLPGFSLLTGAIPHTLTAHELLSLTPISRLYCCAAGLLVRA
jgi:hypothetical protein